MYQEVQRLAFIDNGAPQPFYQSASGRSPEAWRDAGCRRLATEFEKSPPNDLLRDDDPSLRQHVLDVTERQRESRIESNRMSDDIGREAMSLGRDLFHIPLISPQRGSDTIVNVPMSDHGVSGPSLLSSRVPNWVFDSPQARKAASWRLAPLTPSPRPPLGLHPDRSSRYPRSL